MTIRSALVASSVVVSLFAFGCSSPTEEEKEPAKVANQNLELTTRTNDEVAGTYRENGVELVFRLRREGSTRFATLSTRAGVTMIESELRAGVDHAKVLGGRLVEHGDPTEDATLEGDAKALDALLAMPEAKLVAPMKDALVEAGIDRAFVGREPKDTKGGIQPKAYFDGTSWHLGYWEEASFATWSFWGVTTLTVSAYGGNPQIRACAQVYVSGCPEYMCTDPQVWGGNDPRSIQRQWGGARLYVRNTGYWTRYQCGGWTNGGWACPSGRCNDRTLAVRTN